MSVLGSHLKRRRQIRRLQSEQRRALHNETFIARAQEKQFTVEGNALDGQQIEAVVACEDGQLVIAAAGSGKTLSLLAKVEYLVRELGIPEQRILTLSFTKNSADELAERLERLNLHVDGRTFHSLGKSILGDGVKTVYDQVVQQRAVQSIIEELLASDDAFARAHNDYLLAYFTMPTPIGEIDSMKAMVLANRSFQGKTLKDVSLEKSRLAAGYASVKGDRVRSKEEQIIADYLFINNIDYEYEQPHPMYPNYRPDFTITQFGEPIYLEHQGVNRDGRTRADIDPKQYNQKIAWGRHFHESHGAKLIQTYSYEFTEGTALRHLEAQLRHFNAEIIRKDEREIAQLLQRGYSFDVESFYKLVLTYVTLLKTSEHTLDDVVDRIGRIRTFYQRRRTTSFLRVFAPILRRYEERLRSEQAIDFSDMIVQAASRLPSLPPEQFTYDYILVDEVQDLSGARYRLLKALLERNPRTKLFAVGDDWQSIFRFAGSDLSLLQQFDDHFDRHVHHSVIEQTHRFSDEVLEASSRFIRKNPSQLQKRPYSKVTWQTPLIHSSDAEYDSDTTALDQLLTAMVARDGIERVQEYELLLLSRYNRDIERLKGGAFTITNRLKGELIWRYQHYEVPLRFKTIHAAKGLTCDHAFILNANSGKYGIPAERDNDPVIQLLLASEDTYPNAEERRLFYVALTRAKYSTTLISHDAETSSFVNEVVITSPETPANEERCPVCEVGVIEQKSGPYGVFYACSNYRYGCRYNRKSLDVQPSGA